jgi:hypothetical protein
MDNLVFDNKVDGPDEFTAVYEPDDTALVTEVRVLNVESTPLSCDRVYIRPESIPFKLKALASTDGFYEVTAQDEHYTTYKIGDKTSVINNLRLDNGPITAAAKSIPSPVLMVPTAAVSPVEVETDDRPSFESPWSGEKAFKAFLSTLQPKPTGGKLSRELWLKIGTDIFYKCEWAADGSIKGKGSRLNSGKRRATGSEIGYEQLYVSSQCRGGGALYIPTQPQGLPTKESVDSTDTAWVESDQGTAAEQWALYQEFSRVTGLEFSSLLNSGGKSIHGALKFDQHLPVDEAQYLRRLVTIAMISDPAMVRLHQPARIPGFHRMGKGDQVLYSYSHKRYTSDELIAAFKVWFDYRGLDFPASFTDDWWKEFHKVLRGNKVETSVKLSQCQSLLKTGLAGFESGIAEVKTEKAAKDAEKAAVRALNPLVGRSISEQVEAACNSLGSDAFNTPIHDWAWEGALKARGQCHCHKGTTGNSAWLSNANGKWTFHCTTCTNDDPRDAFQYWLGMQQGTANPIIPSGQEYIWAVKNFLTYYGIPFEESGPVHVDSTIQKGDSSSTNGGETPTGMNPIEGGFNEGKTAIAAKALSPQVEIDPEVLALRIAADEHQNAAFWFKLNGHLYKSVTREGLAIRPNILNGNVAAYNLIANQVGAFTGPKLTCQMKIGNRIVTQRPGGHILGVADTGDGKSVVSDAIEDVVNGIYLYMQNQSDIINHAADSMVCHLERMSKSGGEEQCRDYKEKAAGELLIVRKFAAAVREGGLTAMFNSGNATQMAAHSALSAKVYRESKKFWDLFRFYHTAMTDSFGAGYEMSAFHNPGLLFYNRDAIGEIETFAGTEYSSGGKSLALVLAGWSTEDTGTNSRGNMAKGGSGNASNNLTRFSIVALTQPSGKKLFIQKDIAMGSSKYGAAPRIDFLHIENTLKATERTEQAVGMEADKLVFDSEPTAMFSDLTSPFSRMVSEALTRIGTVIMEAGIEGSTTLPVSVSAGAAEVYENFLSWINEVDSEPNRYARDRHQKFEQHFVKKCLNAWLVDLLDQSIGVESKLGVKEIFVRNFKMGITTEQATKAAELMKLHYIEHIIDGAAATPYSSIEGEASPEGRVMDMDTLKAICENKTTLVTWVDSIKDAHVGKAQAKMLEDAVTSPVMRQFVRISGKTLNHYVKIAQSGKEVNIKFA